MLVLVVLIPILTGVFLQALPFAKAGRVIAVAGQCALFSLSVYLFMQSGNGDVTEVIGGFNAQMGIMLRADTLSSVFIMLTAAIFLIATLYSFNAENSRLLWFLFYVWEGLLIGIFLTRDLFNLFVLLEVVTLAVSVMIMFKRDSRSMYDGIFYLMINTVAVQFFLFGAGYLYKITGSFNTDLIAAALKDVDKSSLTLPFSLMMTAVCLKCALVPLHSWLPRAHGTPGSPSSVSAILSGLHVKTGIYIFIRVQSLFADIFISELFLVIGVITGIVGFVFALAQTDIKLILAYHTISQIGLIMIGLSSDNIYSYTGALYHIFSHAMFKSALFLCAGIITKTYKTRNIVEIRGVFRNMPLVGITIIMATLGITGAPFFNGSISKYFITAGAGFAAESAIVLINLGTIISFVKFSVILKGTDSQLLLQKPDSFNQAAAFTLGILCFTGGIFGESAINLLFNVRLEVNIIEYLQKIGLFLISLIAGYLIYKYYIKNNRLLLRLQKADMGFRSICALMGGFFAILIILTKFVSR